MENAMVIGLTLNQFWKMTLAELTIAGKAHALRVDLQQQMLA